MDFRKLIFESWDKWNSRSYLQTYYSKPMIDTVAVIDFINHSLRNAPQKKFINAIDFGAGPTLFSSLAVESYVSHLDIAEFLPQNIKEIKKWIANEANAFDWSFWASYILQKEGKNPTKSAIEEKFQSVREKLGNVLKGDATTNWPVQVAVEKKYDLLISLFCAESITDSKDQWKQNLHNILKLAAPKSMVILSALRNCSSYKVGHSIFPAVPINEVDFENAIRDSSILIKKLDIKVREVPDCADEGFTSIMLARIVLK